MSNLQDILQCFGVATVMNVRVFKLNKHNYTQKGILDLNTLATDEAKNNCLYLNTLTVSNIKTKAPSKTFNVGLYNVPWIRCGTTTQIELKDALGHLDALIAFFGMRCLKNAEQEIIRVYKGNAVSQPLALEGELKIMNVGDDSPKTLYLFIPCLIPNGNLDIIGDSTKQFGVFDLSGNIYPTKVAIDGEYHVETYSLTQNSVLDLEPVDIISSDEHIILQTEINGGYDISTENSEYIFNQEHIDIETEFKEN